MVDYTHYPIEQVNSEDPGSKLEVLQRVLRVASDPFGGDLPPELFVEHETDMALRGPGPWQHFYILDPENGEVICAFRIIINRGNNGYTNLLVSFVHTNADYRKKGFISYLISECIKKYEMVGSYEFLAPGSDNRDTDAYIKRYVTPDKKYFWTLYSAVQTFYAQFGFVPFRGMNWLRYQTQENPNYTISDIQTGDDTIAQLIGFDQDVVPYFANPEYASYLNSALEDDGVRSISLDNPMFHTFHNRDLVVSKHYKKPPQNTGLHLKHSNGKESFVVVSGDLHSSELVIHKFFTNLDAATESEILDDDLDKICMFLFATFDDFAFGELKFVKGYSFALTTSDIHAKDAGTEKYIVDRFQKTKNWSFDASNSEFLPMMKDYAKHGVAEGTQWLNNGFWCFG